MKINGIIRNKGPARTHGLALVMALFVLLVMTFLGVAMLNSAGMQERMAGNQKRIAESSMAAEAGMQGHFSWLAEDPENNWHAPRADRPNNSTTPDEFGYVGGDGGSPLGRYYVEDWASFADYDRDPTTASDDCGPSDDTCVLTVIGESVGGTEVFAQTRLRAIMEYFPDTEPLGGAKDIWAGQNIRINGNAQLVNTYMHSNGGVSEDDGNVNITGGRTTLEQSRITANGDADIKLDPDSDSDQDRCVECSITGDAGIEEPPPDISKRILDWLSDGTVTFGEFDAETGEFNDTDSEVTTETSGVIPSETANCSETFSFNETDLSSGEVYFVNGNVDISTSGTTDFQNVTIISTCEMTHNGALRQGGGSGEVNNVFYSAGDMVFNGATRGNDPATPFEGRFFSGGSMTQNGKSTLTGQIIIEESLALNGEFSFTGANSLGGIVDSQEGSGRVALINWSQVW